MDTSDDCFQNVGCRAGTACQYIHDPTRLTGVGNGPKGEGRPQQVSQPSASKHGAKESKGLPEEIPTVGSSTLQEGRRFLPPPVDSSRVVQKPVSHAHREDPREFQIQQLRRRFSPTEKLEDGGTAFVFQMVPSDPDFPFEMAGLECVLHVPMSYPRNGRPSLDVRNQEMGRGYRINVERGFTALAEVSPQATLLELMNTLDKQLESLLTEQKAETVKIIPNAVVGSSVRQAQVVQPTQANIDAMKPKIQDVSKPPLIYTQEQRRVAQERRDAETRQLEARLGRLPLFSKLSDGIAYNVPVTPRRHADLPVPLQAVKTVKLFVPLLYPLQHCRIEILGVGREAAVNTEKGFERKVKDNPEMSLMGYINYLAQHMHILATEPLEEASGEEKCAPSAPSVESLSIGDLIDDSTTGAALDNEDYRSHVKVIPRPPEWAVGGEGEEDTDSDYSDSYDSRDEGSADELDQNNETHPHPNPDSSNTGPERGILLSFPSLELHGIELLELTSLSLTIKCDRCKEPTDISNLRHASPPHRILQKMRQHPHYILPPRSHARPLLPRRLPRPRRLQPPRHAPQHLHPHLLRLLLRLPTPRHRLRARRLPNHHLSHLPPKTNLPHPRHKIPPHPHVHPQKPSAPTQTRTPRIPRHLRRPRTPPPRPLRPLPQILPLVPLLVLLQSVPLRQVPRRRHGPPERARQPDDLRALRARAELSARGLCGMQGRVGGEAGDGVLGGGQGNEGEG